MAGSLLLSSSRTHVPASLCEDNDIIILCRVQSLPTRCPSSRPVQKVAFGPRSMLEQIEKVHLSHLPCSRFVFLTKLKLSGNWRLNLANH
jgi:hypothetical protein